jgi:hypothetical protein
MLTVALIQPVSLKLYLKILVIAALLIIMIFISLVLIMQLWEMGTS